MPDVLLASRVSQGDESRAEFAVALAIFALQTCLHSVRAETVPAHLPRRESRGHQPGSASLAGRLHCGRHTTKAPDVLGARRLNGTSEPQ
jgi:hypothetical protein